MIRLLVTMETPRAVSYTHLDVYKRQIQNRTRPLRYVLSQSETGVFSCCPFQAERVLSALDYPFFPAS